MVVDRRGLSDSLPFLSLLWVLLPVSLWLPLPFFSPFPLLFPHQWLNSWRNHLFLLLFNHHSLPLQPFLTVHNVQRHSKHPTSYSSISKCSTLIRYGIQSTVLIQYPPPLVPEYGRQIFSKSKDSFPLFFHLFPFLSRGLSFFVLLLILLPLWTVSISLPLPSSLYLHLPSFHHLTVESQSSLSLRSPSSLFLPQLSPSSLCNSAWGVDCTTSSPSTFLPPLSPLPPSSPPLTPSLLWMPNTHSVKPNLHSVSLSVQIRFALFSVFLPVSRLLLSSTDSPPLCNCPSLPPSLDGSLPSPSPSPPSLPLSHLSAGSLLIYARSMQYSPPTAPTKGSIHREYRRERGMGMVNGRMTCPVVDSWRFQRNWSVIGQTVRGNQLSLMIDQVNQWRKEGLKRWWQ